jgi:hypothetical protein
MEGAMNDETRAVAIKALEVRLAVLKRHMYGSNYRGDSGLKQFYFDEGKEEGICAAIEVIRNADAYLRFAE